MEEYKLYKHKFSNNIHEVRPFILGEDISNIYMFGFDRIYSPEDLATGYVSRDPKNHDKLYYVCKKILDGLFEEIK